ncbi:MAG: hypothetical protein IPO27_06100 [Bacteroidetes bacterium]|nr:hypothetical protein [Bacteroidota bacterium]
MNHTLLIKTTKTTFELKREFNRIFPFLRIEFFKNPCVKGIGFTKDKLISRNESLGRIQSKPDNFEFHFDTTITVGEFETHFFKNFGLCVQVFRKSGNVWLETSKTDDWTLDQQNEEGEQLAKHFKIEKEDPEEHDIY